MVSQSESVGLTPVTEAERAPILDVLRGFALLGILLINMEDFSAANVLGLAPIWTDGPDRSISWLLRFAAEGKFRALFSLLFGIGFALLFQRAENQKGAFTALYVRRALVLLFIGIAHYLLLWEADILMTYSLVGLLLLPFARRSSKTVLRAGAVLAGVAVTLLGLIALLAHPRPSRSEGGSHPSLPPEKVQMVAVYSSGSYGDVVAYRARQIGVQFGRIVPMAPLTLMLFLVGLAAGKAGIVRDPAAHRALLRRLFIGCLGFGLIMNALVAIYAAGLMALPKPARLPIVVSYVLGGPTLALCYVSGLTLLMFKPLWQRLLHPLAAPGRMALTNYLLQSVCCSTLCYGYGLGWYNHLRPVAALALCAGIFVMQVVGSFQWLRRFRYGPAEWLWRSLTYGRLLPLRVS